MTDTDWGAVAARAAAVTARVAGITARGAWVGLRTLVVGLVLVAALLANEEKRARARRWFLLEGDRWVIAGMLVVAVFVVSFLLGLVDVVGVAEPAFVTTMFSGMIGGLFSFVPIVISVNQLTISSLFGTPAELRSEIESVDHLRTAIETMHPDEPVSSTEPSEFLWVVVEVINDRADALCDIVPEETAAREAVDMYLDVIRTQVSDINHALGDQRNRLFTVLLPMMGDSYSRNVNDVRRIRTEYGETLSEAATDQLAELKELFVELDILRQYFKSMYIQQELSYLSRMVGYTGIGAFLIAVFLVMLFSNGPPLASHELLLEALVSVGVAAATAPFAMLVSFIVRIGTIAQRTAASGAFTPQRETSEHAKHR